MSARTPAKRPLSVDAPRARAGTDPASAAGAACVVTAGLGLLLIRPALVQVAPRPEAALLVVYAALLAVSVLARLPLDRAPRASAIRIGATLAVGVAAVSVARLFALPAPPTRTTTVAVALSVVAAVAEEALFRRFAYAWLARRGTALAVAGSALLFALVHVPAYGIAALPVDLGAGLLLSWQRFASGGWAAPAATHVAANLLAVLP
jgi:membrane protease YdiL (CAAX protease family)